MSIKFVFPIYCLSNFSFFDVLAINRICLKLKSIRPAGVAGVAMPFPFFTGFGSLHGATQEGSTWGIMESWSPSNLTVLHFPKLQGQGSDLACISSTYPAFHAFLQYLAHGFHVSHVSSRSFFFLKQCGHTEGFLRSQLGPGVQSRW